MADMFMECFPLPRAAGAADEPDIDMPDMELPDPAVPPPALADAAVEAVQPEAEAEPTRYRPV